MRMMKAAGAVLAVMLLVTAVTVAGPGGPGGSVAAAAALEPFGDCDELLDYFRDQTAQQMAERERQQTGMEFVEDAVFAPAPGAPMPDAAAGPGAAGPAGAESAVSDTAAPVGGDEAFSGTNVQEEGVDEPDIVKTDGRWLYAVARQRLQVMQLGEGAPRLVTTRPLPAHTWRHELLLDGNRLLVVSSGFREEPVPLPGPDVDLPVKPDPGLPVEPDFEPPVEPDSGLPVEPDFEPPVEPDSGLPVEPDFEPPVGSALPVEPARPEPAAPAVTDAAPGVASDAMFVGTPFTLLSLLDVTDPATPVEESSLRLDGDYVSARMVGGVARVVLRSHPRVGHPEPAAAGAVELDSWLPTYAVAGPAGAAPQEGPLLSCEQVHRPVEPAGTGTVSVLSVDLATDLAPESATAVVADAETVYASTERLYVAVHRWQDTGTNTEIHAFDISDPAGARYVASGQVPGRLLNQFSLSEHEGYLRVATTIDGGMRDVVISDDVRGATPARDSESAVWVLAEQGQRLETVGQVGGLGKTEQIHAVRFLGDLGFVVTFRQTDPLYTLDLSDPAAPKVLGELKITGYSAYLHPLGDGLLLGVGQDATEDGQRLGTQVAVFDVSDLARPQRLHQVTVPGSASEIEYDHRAFLYWAPERLAVVPLERWEPPGFVGAHAYRVGRDGIAEQDRLSQPQTIRRTLVAGGRLHTVSEAGVSAHDLSSLAGLGFTGFSG